MQITYNNITLNNYILKITGIFNYNKEFISKSSKNGYKQLEFTEKELIFNKDYFYPDLRMQFFSNDKNRHHILIKDFGELNFIKLFTKSYSDNNKTKEIDVFVKNIRLDLFDESFALFTISLNINSDEVNLQTYSDASFLVRNFDTLIEHNKYEKWYQYIEGEVLMNYATRGKTVLNDEYSGSKYKLFMVLDVNELLGKDALKSLILDIGTLSQIGSVTGNNYDSMDEEYSNKLISNNSISIYNNWKGLVLLDTFTIVGNKVLDQPYKKDTHNSVYFIIYLYGLFIKYNLYRINLETSGLNEDKRDYFQNFLNKYYYNYISYNFLPAEIYNKVKAALDIDKELSFMNEKVIKVGQKIQEEQQNKTNKILGIVTVLSSVASAGPVFDYMLKLHEWLDWNEGLFWVTVITFLLITTVALVFYIFGNKFFNWKNKE